MGELEDLARNTNKHPAIENPFFDIWIKRRLGIVPLEVFGRNYGEWVRSFPDALAILLYTTDDEAAKIEYVKTLHSEMGYGNPEKIHWKLLDFFLSELASKSGNPKRLDRGHLSAIPPLPTTIKLIQGERELYANRDERIAVGAQLALEWQAYTMLRKLYEGARNYKDLWENEDEFHEACEYFYAHIGAAEKDHKIESLKAAQQYATDTKSFEKMNEGFNLHLQLISEFWNEIYNEIRRLSQNAKDNS